MKETRLTEIYTHAGCLIGNQFWYRRSMLEDPPQVRRLIGRMSSEQCPQCGASLYKNEAGNIWCWNCDFREYVGS